MYGLRYTGRSSNWSAISSSLSYLDSSIISSVSVGRVLGSCVDGLVGSIEPTFGLLLRGFDRGPLLPPLPPFRPRLSSLNNSRSSGSVAGLFRPARRGVWLDGWVDGFMFGRFIGPLVGRVGRVGRVGWVGRPPRESDDGLYGCLYGCSYDGCSYEGAVPLPYDIGLKSFKS